MGGDKESKSRKLLNDTTRIVRVFDYDMGQIKFMTIQQAKENGMIQILK